jgi:DNA-binding response OmpR family regulator
MLLTLVLAVAVDSSLLASRRFFWESAGCYVTSAGSIREAILQFRDGDFDLILLGDSIPIESRERLTFLIRASGSGIPVVCVTDSPGDHDSFADATIRNDGDDLLLVMEELLAARKSRRGSAAFEADEAPQFHLLGDVRTLQMLWPRNTFKTGGGFR